MKRFLLIFSLSLSVAECFSQVEIAAKLNAFYACLGVVNPSAEFVISPKSTIQTEFVYSPWESVNGHKMRFGIFMTEYRWHLKDHFRGVYFGANAGMQIFKVSKPYFEHGKLHFNTGYAKGCGALIGLSVGYEKVFADRWVFDAFVGWSRMWSFYNGYDSNREIMMYPEGHENDNPPDPWNGSAEWYPNKIGVSLGYVFNKK